MTLQLESAITTIMDCEDSVAAVDAEDKCRVYGNWNGLMKGDLTEAVQKGDRVINRVLEKDKQFIASRWFEVLFARPQSDVCA